METPETDCKGPIRDAEADLAKAAAAMAAAAAAIGRTADAATDLPTRMNVWAVAAQAAVTVLWRQAETKLDDLLKVLP